MHFWYMIAQASKVLINWMNGIRKLLITQILELLSCFWEINVTCLIEKFLIMWAWIMREAGTLGFWKSLRRPVPTLKTRFIVLLEV